VSDVPITILTEAELRRCVELDAEVIDAVADAFTTLAAGRVAMPPVLHMDRPGA
jgi:ornithine cyclodeaminase/alanine dehydrogenase-like protein (mu-crystallin family)